MTCYEIVVLTILSLKFIPQIILSKSITFPIVKPLLPSHLFTVQVSLLLLSMNSNPTNRHMTNYSISHMIQHSTICHLPHLLHHVSYDLYILNRKCNRYHCHQCDPSSQSYQTLLQFQHQVIINVLLFVIFYRGHNRREFARNVAAYTF